ncbi:MAG: hypothetical protein A3C06_03895 [Candidatus Taylorbacteria bacterium RIFCSPHIGHO2_02_FULL_46_13]|uniref:Cell division protein FtsX n=1 Tax=Candidatus Taylorbacteria bacterium RIFCSPHIGHO2_02_FULL_46_13 TaxID=1802312 RepID=A0A1G2MQF5_9BACT|nr:MAG: hypothetical protein A3C06_03895 [Candidatus Taylorbacteria bacterium RIFCSPHIGHO2_02_FULL_46_13]
MFWINIKRVLRTGLMSFWRNGFVSVASILVMTITLFVVGSLVFNNALLQSSLKELTDKVDINVYFVNNAPEEDILALQKTLQSFPEVASVEYISSADALAQFKTKHQDDQLILQALDEVSDNPLGAVLNIKTNEPSQYEGVANYLKQNPVLSKGGTPLVDKVNYFQNKVAIDKLNEIINSSRKSSFARTLVLILASLAVAFNTIRLAIYVTREEISVMRLVGASNMYIRGPFIVAGIIYGLVSAIIAMVVFYPVTYWFGPLFYPLPIFLTSGQVGDLRLFQYYLANFAQISLIILACGFVLGGLSSYLAVRRYLR